MTCPGCGAEIAERAVSCPACGASVTEGPSSFTTEPPTEPASLTEGTAADRVSLGRLVPGVVLAGRFRIAERLGGGGMGEVYRADDLGLGQPVALKVLRQEWAGSEGHLAELRAEVRVARSVSHANVCRIFDIGEADGRVFISMEYVDGKDLASLLVQIGRLTQDKGVEVARQLCLGLHAVHAAGIVHRDLKPANVMLDGKGRVRITDFGLARDVDRASQRGTISGTLPYMAPEQRAGMGTTIRSDLYSLGIVLHEIFTGRRPPDFAKRSIPDSSHSEARPSPSADTADLDPAVERVVLWCLENDPASRPPSALHVASALPGADPLAAFLAAGLAPPPEAVADAGGSIGLRPASVFLLGAAMAASIGALFALAPHSTVVGRSGILLSPEILESRARATITLSGWTEPAVDREAWFDMRREPGGPSLVFEYRQSPKPMVARAEPRIDVSNPALDVPGMVSLTMDGEGRLRGFHAVPSGIDAGRGPPSRSDDAFLREAGFEQRNLESTVPSMLPPVPFDLQREWRARTSPDGRGRVICEASFRGLPVWFAVTAPGRAGSSVGIQPAPKGMARAVAVALPWTLALTVALLARRNVRLGRGDRRGARWAGWLVFASTFFRWILAAHYSGEATGHTGVLADALREAAFVGGYAWLGYMAFEPFARRHWPLALVSWTRLIGGRPRDPLVARDLLIGLSLGCIGAAGAASLKAAGLKAGAPGIVPGIPEPLFLATARHVLAGLFTYLEASLLQGIFLLALLVVVRIVVRRRDAAVLTSGALVFLVAVGNLGGGAFSLAQAALLSTLSLLAVARFGLLAVVALIASWQILERAPLTADLSRWYSSHGLLCLALVLAVAAFAAANSLRGRLRVGAVLDG